MTAALLWVLLAATPSEQRLRAAMETAQRDGDGAAIAAVLRDETRKNPTFAPGWRLLGEYCLGRGDATCARDALSRFLELTPGASNPDVKLQVQLLNAAVSAPSPKARDALLYEVWAGRSASALARGDVATGLLLAQRAVALVPTRPEAHAQLGAALELLERPSAAQREFGEALVHVQDPTERELIVQGLLRTSRAARAEASERTADALVAAGRQREAAWHYLEAFEAQPAQAQRGITAALALFASGELALARETLHHAELAADDEPLRTIAEIRKRIPSLARVVDETSERLWLESRDTCFASSAPEPLENLKRAAQKAHTARFQLALAECLAARGDLSAAKAVLEKTSPTPMTWSARAALALASADPAGAEQAARAALALMPSSPRAHRLLGAALAAQNAPDAEQTFKVSLSLDPREALALSGLAELFAPTKTKAALKRANQAVEARPWLSEVWLARASVHFRAGRVDEGKADSKRAAELLTFASVLRERLGREP